MKTNNYFKSKRQTEAWMAEKAAQTLKQIDWYLTRNWPVFPAGKNKAPCTPNGCRDATTDRTTIAQWWGADPLANVAIATGRKSGLLVIDVDIKDGKDGLRELFEIFPDELDIDVDRQLVAYTPSGGIHLYYQWDESSPVSVAAGVLPGVDIRGEGGYVLAPPSTIQIDGKWQRYTWHDATRPVPPLPTWARMLILSTKRSTNSPSEPYCNSALNIKEVLSGVPQGRRDDQLFRYACHLRKKDISYELAVGFIREAAVRCNPPFSEAVAVEKVNAAYDDLLVNQIINL